MYPALGLRLIGTVTASLGPREPALYEVTGLTHEDVCIIGYAGLDYYQKPQWSLTWYWTAKIVDTPERTYDSPEDALVAAEEVWAKMRPLKSE
jgi:hypothetical protein